MVTSSVAVSPPASDSDDDDHDEDGNDDAGQGCQSPRHRNQGENQRSIRLASCTRYGTCVVRIPEHALSLSLSLPLSHTHTHTRTHTHTHTFNFFAAPQPVTYCVQRFALRRYKMRSPFLMNSSSTHCTGSNQELQNRLSSRFKSGVTQTIRVKEPTVTGLE